MDSHSAITTILFTDLVGSTRLWEEDSERMRGALASHDAIARQVVKARDGVAVKMTGDGIHAVFGSPIDAVAAAVDLQLALANPMATQGIQLHVRCGLHVGVAEHRDRDFFGTHVNRAARIMAAANGGQILASEAIVKLVGNHPPAGASFRDLGVVRLRDLSNPEHIYQVLHPELRHEFPALRTLESTPNNLRQQLSTFIGRKRELIELRRLLGGSRLITLHGVGGIGKTRLALQAAAEVLEDYPDGIWLVELASIADARVVPLAVASVLGVKEGAEGSLLRAILEFVKDRKLLLILDNCEHLHEACGKFVVQMLQVSPHLRIIVTSRESLHVWGEAKFPVPPLSIPEANNNGELVELQENEAVSLFIDRANAACPSLKLTQRQVPALASICRRLDGIPLAIELAAARARVLSIERIDDRLNDLFGILTRGDTTALPRQQTLRALIDWSFALLTENERALFRRLAVFAGGWTLEAAESLGTGSDFQEDSVVSLLANLVDKSIVAMDPDGERYRLLETIRQYAQERLKESSELSDARTRHLHFYLSLAESASVELVGSNQGVWLARLGQEAENLLAAHAWCDSATDGGELGLRLVFAVKLYLFYRGRLALLRRVVTEALARPGAQTRGRARCRVLHAGGQVGFLTGHYEEAKRYLDESLSIAMELGDKDRAAMVLEELGAVSAGMGDLVNARDNLEHAVLLTSEGGNKRALASAINALAQLDRMEGELETAERLYHQVVALARDLEDQESTAIGLLNLAMVSMGKHAYSDSLEYLKEALAIADATGSTRAGQSGLLVSAGWHALNNAWERAAISFGAAHEQKTQCGLHGDPTDEAYLAPLYAKVQETLGPTAFAAAEAIGRALTYDAAIAQSRNWLDLGR